MMLLAALMTQDLVEEIPRLILTEALKAELAGNVLQQRNLTQTYLQCVVVHLLHFLILL